MIEMVLSRLSTRSDCTSETDTCHDSCELSSCRFNEEESLLMTLITVNKDNLRLLLLALFILIYIAIGATIFQTFEESNELAARVKTQVEINQELKWFEANLKKGNLSMDRILNFVYLWSNASESGQLQVKKKWNYAGSFHFAYMIVSTIGFGQTTPSTLPGKIFCIFYGLLGCSSGILFFNLFLERIITIFAYFMKARLKREMTDRNNGNIESTNYPENNLETWKPSVYWVMFYLCILSIILGGIVSVLYMEIEGWSYMDSVYFCFITFSTIGFGDYVSAKQPNSYYGSGVDAYQLGNFIIMVFGCCCIYSLFNIISITIKQTLNWLIKKLLVCCAIERFLPFGQRDTMGVVAPLDKSQIHLSRDGLIAHNTEVERRFSAEIFTTHESGKIKLNHNPIGSNKRIISSGSPITNQNLIRGHVGSVAIASSKFMEGSF